MWESYVEQQISIRPVAETAGVGEPGEWLNGEIWGGGIRRAHHICRERARSRSLKKFKGGPGNGKIAEPNSMGYNLLDWGDEFLMVLSPLVRMARRCGLESLGLGLGLMGVPCMD